MTGLRTNGRGEAYVIGPTGAPVTLASLPPPSTERWVPRRKAEVVAAVRGGLISRDDALQRYGISDEEFTEWTRAVQRYGTAGLRVTRLQQYREVRAGVTFINPHQPARSAEEAKNPSANSLGEDA